MRGLGRNNVLKRFFVSYLIVLMIPVLMGAYLYSRTVRVVEEDAILANSAILNQNKDMMDQRLLELEHISNRFSMLAKIRSALSVSEPFSNEDHYLFTEIKKDMGAYITSELIADFMIYLKKSDTLISNTGGIYHGEEEYRRFMPFGNLDYRAWTSLITQGIRTYIPPDILHLEGRRISSAAMAASLYTGSLSNPDGAIVFYIEESKLNKLLEHISGDQGGWAYIMNAQGGVMASTGKNLPDIPLHEVADKEGHFHKELNGEQMLVAYTVSDYNGWKYISVMPSEAVLAKVVYIKKSTAYVTSAALLLGLIATVFLSYRQSKPLQELVQSFRQYVTREKRRSESEYEFMKGSLDDLVSRKQHLEQLLDDQLPLLRSSFLYKLLQGEFHSAAEMEAFEAQARQDMQHSSYLLLWIRVQGYGGIITADILKELHFNKFVVKNLLEDTLGPKQWMYDRSEDSIVIWYGPPTGEEAADRKELAHKLGMVEDLLLRKFSIQITAAVSSRFESLYDSWKAYQQLRQTTDYGLRSGVVWTEELAPTGGYYYPMEVEAKLINTVMAGETGELTALLQHIYAENVQNRRLALTVVHQLAFELKGTWMKLGGQIQVRRSTQQEEWHSRLEQMMNREFTEYFEIVSESLQFLCEEARQNRNRHNEDALRQMLQFIEQQYSSTELSLASLADHMKLSESYISTFFKQFMNQNFSVYLENKRLDKAGELLLHSGLSIQEIALQVGYNSDRAFRRAFKRVKGVQPTQYRDSFR
jgi:AraC-like DNA-binding protein